MSSLFSVQFIQRLTCYWLFFLLLNNLFLKSFIVLLIRIVFSFFFNFLGTVIIIILLVELKNKANKNSSWNNKVDQFRRWGIINETYNVWLKYLTKKYITKWNRWRNKWPRSFSWFWHSVQLWIIRQYLFVFKFIY